MKNILLLIVISAFAFGMVGCGKSDEGADTTADAAGATTGGTTSGTTGAAPAPVSGAKASAGTPTHETAGVTLGANAKDPKWAAGTMAKGK
jgi:hypothetical protein